MSEWILCEPIRKKKQINKQTNKQNIKKYISKQKPVQIYLIIQINIGIFARESTTKTWTAFHNMESRSYKGAATKTPH